MDYKITMPQLSDSMSEGKLVEWKVKVGDKVSSGDVIADIESDKAVIEVQTFKSGVVKELLLKENEEAKVGSVIAVIDTDTNATEDKKMKQQNEQKNKPPKESKPAKEPEQKPKNKKPKEQNEQQSEQKEDILDILFSDNKASKSLQKGVSSPAAKQKASSLGIDIQKLQNEGKLPTPAFEKDIDEAVKKIYFTPKAKKMLQEYGIDVSYFKLDHKIDTNEVKNYIKMHNIPKIVKLSINQKAVINTVTKSWQKPVYHIFEEVEIHKKEGIKLTANILKALANSMQKFDFSRSVLKEGVLKVYPTSNISVALSKENSLYMVVLKNVEDLSLEEIHKWLKSIKQKKIRDEELKGSTFGISNLGMFDIDSFDALINAQDSAIAAFGALKNGKMSVTFTFDHRIVNGVKAAQFVMDFKEELKNI